MRRLPLAFLLALLVLPLSGCVESTDTVTLKKDGSGTVVSVYETDLAKYRELQMTLAALGLANAEQVEKAKDEELFNMEHPAWARTFAAKAKGYTITKASQTIKDKKRSTTIEGAFTSLEEAARGGAFAVFNVELSEVEKSETVPNGAWKFVISTPLAGNADATGGMDMQQLLPSFEAQLNTLKTSFVLNLPSKILETNGKKEENGTSVSWTYTFDDLMDTEADATMTVVFEAGEDVQLKAFKYETDVNALLQRASQMPPKEDAGKAAAAGKEGGDAPAAGEEKKPAEPVTTPSTPDTPKGDGK
jgi:hypothetical protein